MGNTFYIVCKYSIHWNSVKVDYEGRGRSQCKCCMNHFTREQKVKSKLFDLENFSGIYIMEEKSWKKEKGEAKCQHNEQEWEGLSINDS